MSKKRRKTQEEEEQAYQEIVENSTSTASLKNSIKVTIKCKSENQKKLTKKKKS